MDSDYSLEYLGRKIEANIVKTEIPVIIVDIYQKQGDCVMGYNLEQRMQCEKDCQNTFMSIFFDAIKKEISTMAMLSRSVPVYLVENLKKLGIMPDDIRHIYEANPRNFEVIRNETCDTLLYKSMEVMEVHKCSFLWGDKIITEDPEFKPYLDLILNDTEGLLERCGITFKGPFIINMKEPKNLLEFMRARGNG